MALSTASSGGLQTQTSSPQSASGSTTGSNAESFQPTAQAQALNGNNQTDSIGLNNKPLPSVNLPATAQTATSQYQPPVHHASNSLAAFALLFLVVAAVLFLRAHHTAKNTTI